MLTSGTLRWEFIWLLALDFREIETPEAVEGSGFPFSDSSWR
jgi:hypothetical protein